MGPCSVKNPTAAKTFRGKSGKGHWKSGLGHNSVLFVFPVTTKIRGGSVKEGECFKKIMPHCSKYSFLVFMENTQNYNTHSLVGMVNIGDSHGRVWPEPMQ